jgi:DNA-binding LacI/PurR family transcriptional regulator
MPCAVITNDISAALAALEAVEAAGLHCPRDVSICTTGFAIESSGPESLPFSRFFRLSFTTADWSIEDLGRQAATLLLARLQASSKPHTKVQSVVIPARLVRGDSTIELVSVSSPSGPATKRSRSVGSGA